MQSFLLVLDIIVAGIITILVLLQRSEGGLGGLTGQSGSLFTARQTGNMLSTLTMIFFAVFVAVSLALVVLARQNTYETAPSIVPGSELPTE